MKNSFDSEVGPDLLVPHQNGFDGRLISMSLRLKPDAPCLEASVGLQVVATDEGGRESWHRVAIELTSLSFLRVSEEWFVGGGCVLYNGGRLLLSGETGDVVLDLDPGVAWLSPSGVRHESSFLMRGKGSVTTTPVN